MICRFFPLFLEKSSSWTIDVVTTVFSQIIVVALATCPIPLFLWFPLCYFAAGFSMGREAAIMADISLPGDTGAFMDYDAEDPREEREGGNLSLRELRTQQSKARKKSREQAKSAKKQVALLFILTDILLWP